MASSSNSHTSKRRMARSDEQLCDLCNRTHQGAACPVMTFVTEQMAQFSRRGNRKRRDSSRRPTREDQTMSPVGNRQIGRPSFLASRSEKTPGRGSERTTDRCFKDSFLDRTSIQIPDRRSEASHAKTDAKDKSHIQCVVCTQYGHYSTQCNQNPKARKYLRRGNLGEQHTPTTTEDGEHGDPTPMGHMVDATIAEQEDPTPMVISYNNSYTNIHPLLGRWPEVACKKHRTALAGLLAPKEESIFNESFKAVTAVVEALEVFTKDYDQISRE
ncbi:hypothetical protein Dimus_007720 [Dionaea muscipula]